MNELLKDAVNYKPWLRILGRKTPDKRMRDEELLLRFFAFHIQGVNSYRTPQKHWLNDAAKAGKSYSKARIGKLNAAWETSIDVALTWFDPDECFRRTAPHGGRAINRALFDLVMQSASHANVRKAKQTRGVMRRQYSKLLNIPEFNDLISRAVDHTKRNKRRFEMWHQYVGKHL